PRSIDYLLAKLDDTDVASQQAAVNAISALGPLAGAATVGTLDGPSRRAAYLQVQDTLAGLHAVAQVLAAPDGRSRQLLVLDVTGRSTRAAVAVGDVDRAEHVAVVVPGFTTSVPRDLVGADRLAADLAALARREAMAWGDRGDVAVVSWLGYDAPQVADTLRTRSVALRGSAQEGADLLSPFLRGLPPAAHLTLVGHSYGSTTAGLAVTRGGTGVDDLVAIGSPGLGVGSTAELGMPAARVHVLEAAQDPVADLGWFGRDPGRLAGVDRPSTDATVLPDGSAGTRSLGHSSYLTPGTTSQWNVAAVVAGLPRQQP
ncbi:MAG: alpha/beta hydrolase, partial [Lapillicoccus sp.]